MFEKKYLSSVLSQQASTLRLGECPDIVTAFLLGQHVQKKNQTTIMIVSSFERLNLYENLVRFFFPTIELVVLPPWDCLPYDRTGASPEIVSRRIQAFRRIYDLEQEKKPYVLLTTITATLQKIRNPEIIKKSSVLAKPKKRVQIDRLCRFLSENGYLRTHTVREAGEFAVRGGILDVYPSGQDNPVRLDFFGDVIEKIKIFDPQTQITTETLDQFELSPISEIMPNQKTIDHFKTEYRLLCGGSINRDDVFYRKISEGHGYVQGMEAYLPLFDSNLITIFDAVPNAFIFIDSYSNAVKHEFLADVQDYYQNRKALMPVIEPQDLYLIDKQFDDIIKNHKTRLVTSHNLPDIMVDTDSVMNLGYRIGFNFVTARKTLGLNLFDEAVKIINQMRESGKQVFITATSEGSRERLMTTFQDHGLENITISHDFWNNYQINPQTVSFVIADLVQGCVSDHVCFLTEQDIFGQKVRNRRKKNKKADQFLVEAAGLSIGDYIVHTDHGVGQYMGLVPLTVSNVTHDCILLVYAGGDKLYIPVENLDLITRYGGDAGGGSLDRLGSASWQSRKSKLKKKILDIADGLIKTAAERLLRTADVIEPDPTLYDDFKARFAFEETEDQLCAIEAIEDDLASGRPADRLICGDVGFGKTEVAMRAAFITASQGIQTAVVVPTTLLVRQHYRNFVERFKGFNINIGRLSRMVPAKEVSETKQNLTNGSCHIVIGTHALLSESIKFKNLGLLVIDEEQHFGVTHKEKLKNLKSDLHVLTLTATPIPRTLQLSMTGVRDLSLITTPPIDRLAIRTYVAEFEKNMVREALLREKYRGGQAFIVVPRVTDLEEIGKFLQEYVPELSFVTASGQMPANELDSVMNDFYDGKFDVLAATTIIESGIDIPTANTMIVWRADMFGLSQLYQIRGRIGRSKLRAYAYLTYKPKTILTESAEKRLKVLESLDKLGGGFTLASHDMDIRGTGNLLGSQQSGHIKEVGFELYQQMLEEALATLKSGDEAVDTGTENKSPQINLGVSAIIPETYISDLEVRMGLYRRLSALDNLQDIDAMAVELVDRFGKMPIEVNNLLKIIDLKSLCKQAHIGRLDVGEKGVLITFHNSSHPNPELLIEFITTQKGKAKLRSDHKISIKADMLSPRDRYMKCKKIIEQLTLS
ncbi:MAG: transcription-repair coupling factor (superfamily II helicase) [Alphaproteobacteria bacterium]|jgi:transcription-repair coupling factor (superfamily II helicase)